MDSDITKFIRNILIKPDFEQRTISDELVRVQVDNRGQPEKIVDVLEIEEIDISPIDIFKIHAKGNVLTLNKPLSVSVDFDRESQEFVVEYPEMGIVIGAETREDLITEFCKDFYWVWQEYGQGNVTSMSHGAIKLRQLIKNMVKEIQKA